MSVMLGVGWSVLIWCLQVREIDAQCVVFSVGWNGSVHARANLMIYLAVFMAAEWLSFVFCRVGFGGS